MNHAVMSGNSLVHDFLHANDDNDAVTLLHLFQKLLSQQLWVPLLTLAVSVRLLVSSTSDTCSAHV